MRTIVFLISFLLIYIHTFGQVSYFDQKYDLIKVWGILKYYAPKFSKGKIDADAYFIAKYKAITDFKSKDSFYVALYRDIDSFAEVKSGVTTNTHIHFKNIDEKHACKLYMLLGSEKTGVFYTTQGCLNSIPCFKNEVTYKPEFLKSDAYKLLIVARLWNIVNFLSPDREINANRWSKTLEFLLQNLEISISQKDFDWLILEMMSSTCDPHAGVYGGSIGYLGNKFFPPIDLKYINGQLLLESFSDTLLTKQSVIRIKSIDHMSLDSIEKRFSKYVADTARLVSNILRFYVLPGDSGSKISFTCESSTGQLSTLETKRYLSFDSIVSSRRLRTSKFQAYFKYADSVIYIDLSEAVNLKLLKSDLKTAKIAVIDLRKYPLWDNITALENFFSKPTSLCLSKSVDFHSLSRFKFSKLLPYKLYKFHPIKTAILVSQNTFSRGEYFAILLKTLGADPIVIGTTTAGATGEFVTIPLYGEVTASYTGTEIVAGSDKYLKIGIRPDIFEIIPDEISKGSKEDFLSYILKLIHAHK